MGGFSLGLCLPFLIRDDFSKHHRQSASVVVVVHVVKHEPKRSPIPSVGVVRFNVIEVHFNPGVGALPTGGQCRGVIRRLGFDDTLYDRFGRIFFFSIGPHFCRPKVKGSRLEADVDLLRNAADHGK